MVRKSISRELREYCARVLDRRARGGTLMLRAPVDGIRFYEGGGCIVVHRDGQFQAELMFQKPNIQVERHIHADVESVDFLISGDVFAELNGVMEVEPKPPRPDGLAHDFLRGHDFPLAVDHAGASGPRGACVLCVQRWHNGRTPTSIIDGQDIDAKT